MAIEHYREEMHRWRGNDKYIKSGTYLEAVRKILLKYTIIWSYFVLEQ